MGASLVSERHFLTHWLCKIIRLLEIINSVFHTLGRCLAGFLQFPENYAHFEEKKLYFIAKLLNKLMQCSDHESFLRFFYTFFLIKSQLLVNIFNPILSSSCLRTQLFKRTKEPQKD